MIGGHVPLDAETDEKCLPGDHRPFAQHRLDSSLNDQSESATPNPGNAGVFQDNPPSRTLPQRRKADLAKVRRANCGLCLHSLKQTFESTGFDPKGLDDCSAVSRLRSTQKKSQSVFEPNFT